MISIADYTFQQYSRSRPFKKASRLVAELSADDVEMFTVNNSASGLEVTATSDLFS
jgi:hypothetical protein